MKKPSVLSGASVPQSYFLIGVLQGILVEVLDDSDYVTKPVGSMSTRSQSSCAHRNSWKVVGPEGRKK